MIFKIFITTWLQCSVFIRLYPVLPNLETRDLRREAERIWSLRSVQHGLSTSVAQKQHYVHLVLFSDALTLKTTLGYTDALNSANFGVSPHETMGLDRSPSHQLHFRCPYPIFLLDFIILKWLCHASADLLSKQPSHQSVGARRPLWH